MMEKHFKLIFYEWDFDKFRLRRKNEVSYHDFRCFFDFLVDGLSLSSNPYFYLYTLDNYCNAFAYWAKKYGNKTGGMYMSPPPIPHLLIKSYRNFDKNAIMRAVWRQVSQIQAGSAKEVFCKGASPFFDSSGCAFEVADLSYTTKVPFSLEPCALYEIHGIGEETFIPFSPDYEPSNPKSFLVRIEYGLEFSNGDKHLLNLIVGSIDKIRAYYSEPILYTEGVAYVDKIYPMESYQYSIIDNHVGTLENTVRGRNEAIVLMNFSHELNMSKGNEVLGKILTEGDNHYICSPDIIIRTADGFDKHLSGYL